ncbi:MAG TPA: M1 family metallopeptidase [Myxococcales bacterium]|nr:M1 family metallopeptidase [Myxococcales bacterium]
MENRDDVRLPRSVRPRRYQLHFDVDPGAALFAGRADIELALDRPVEAIELHAVELDVGEAALDGQALTVEKRPEVERLRLKLPRAVGPGAARLSLAFQGSLQKGLRGLYRAESSGRSLAFTQFEPADARRAFPCFDEPDFKAVFELSATVPSGMRALSNGAIVSETVSKSGRRTFGFAPTPPISTYLVALGVGELACVESACGESPVRVWAVPEKVGLGKPALEMACAFLPWLAEWFGVPYPYGKLDLVAVPDFEAGAMENAGALFFRESTLLLDPEKATLGATRQVAITVAHEMAHQWFGDLVTMEWWDDLWLNEAFATWMEFKAVDAWRPGWNLWTDFERMKAHPLHLDSLRATRPIQAEVKTPEQANEMFDGITYSKGAAVLRMFEVSLGEARFQAGVRAYIQAHREGNAKAADLWADLGKATGRNVAELARSWFTQGGYPLLTLEEGGAALELSQRRFFAKAEDAKAAAPALWRVPLAVKVGRAGRSELVTGEMEGAATRLALPAGPREWVLGNAEGSGFYRVAYPAPMLAALAAHREALSPVERVSLLADQWALVRAGAPLAAHLPLLDAFAADPGRAVLETAMGQLASLDDVVVAEADRDVLRTWLRSRLEPHAQRLGWEPSASEGADDLLLRPALLETLGAVGADPQVRAEARRRLEAGQLHPSVMGVALRLSAASGDGALYDRFLERMRAAAVPEERDRLLSALGSFEAPELVDRALADALGQDVRAQDVASLFGMLFMNRKARVRTWRFVTERWREVAAKAPAFGLRRIVSATARLCDPELRREVAAFFAAPEHHVEAGKRDLEQALEAIDIGLAFRAREQAKLAGWLRAR